MNKHSVERVHAHSIEGVRAHVKNFITKFEHSYT